MYHKSQKEITKRWQGSEIVVSICCITYNHESYIEEALNSFLMQETNFPFEVVIHDDASTDNTANIIKLYEEKYPKIFRPIYQSENQKSKFKSGMNPRFNYPRAKGKYIAICEGDDYWTDPCKLQKQVDFLEKNPNYSLSCHNAKVINGITGESKLFNTTMSKSTFTTKDVIINSWFTPTASIVFKPIVDWPKNYQGAGDILILFLSSIQGKIYYNEDVMSVYNYGSASSLSKGLLQNSKYKRLTKLYSNKLRFLQYVDKKTNYRFFAYTFYKRIRMLAGFVYQMIFK